MFRLLLALPPFVGCAPAADHDWVAEDSRSAPEGWAWEDTAADAPELDPEVLAADIQANLEAMYSVKATVPLASFVEAYALHTDSCPMNPVITETPGYGSTLYFDGLCTHEPVDFKGPALFYTWDAESIDPIAAMSAAAGLPPDIRWTGLGFNGQTDIYSDDGELDFNCSCTMVDVVGTAPDGASWFFGVTSGTAHWSGPMGQGTWMDDPAVVPELQLIINDQADNRSIRAGGTLSGVGERYGSMGWQLELDAVRSGESWSCSASGLVHVSYRDSADTRWATVDLAVSADCAACGTTDGGVEVCVDLARILDFEGSPW